MQLRRADLLTDNVDMSKPLPLGYARAVERGMELRGLGTHMSYTVIATVIGEYHGFVRSASWWRDTLIAAGAPKRELYNRALPSCQASCETHS